MWGLGDCAIGLQLQCTCEDDKVILFLERTKGSSEVSRRRVFFDPCNPQDSLPLLLASFSLHQQYWRFRAAGMAKYIGTPPRGDAAT